MKTYTTILATLATGLLLVLNARPAAAEEAPDFPPGVFTDGNFYSLEQLRGEVVVLFFYEQGCPTCTKKIPERNKLVELFKDQPVTFIAIAAGDTESQAKAYVKRNKLAMPAFVDKLSLMEKLYDIKISFKNIYQFRVIGPKGNIVGYRMDADTINRALDQIQTTQAYDPADYNEALKPVVNLLNNDDHKAALRRLGRLLRDRDEAVKDSARLLNEAVLAQARGWVEQADGLVQTDPFKARSLYTKASNLFPREAFAKEIRSKIAKLRSNPLFKQETAARKMFAKMVGAIDQMKPGQFRELVAYARQIGDKYPDTPTGQRCAKMADKLGS